MKATVYIWASNAAKWKEISNKSEWINTLLNGDLTSLERKIERIAEDIIDRKLRELQG